MSNWDGDTPSKKKNFDNTGHKSTQKQILNFFGVVQFSLIFCFAPYIFFRDFIEEL